MKRIRLLPRGTSHRNEEWVPEGSTSEVVMLDEAMIEQRLTTLEHTVAGFQRLLTEVPASGNWLAKVTGSISDEPAFLEALELGRAFRLADRPPDETNEEP